MFLPSFTFSGWFGIVYVSTAPDPSWRMRAARPSRSSFGSTLRLSFATWMSSAATVGLVTFVNAFAIARFTKSCWRLMRPKSDVSSDTHLPAFLYSRCRDRTHSRPMTPSSRTHPGFSTSSPVFLSRTGVSKYTDTPPMASTRALKLAKLTST